MPNLQAITRERHATLHWRPNTRYAFAAQDAVVPLVAQELAAAMLHMPLALMAVEAGGLAQYEPVALQGLSRGENLFVSPDGHWTGGYTPAPYRGHPFVVAKTPDGAQVLCVDEDSGLLDPVGGEPFFAQDGQPSRALTDVFNFLSHVRANRSATAALCALWQKHQLIQPWALRVRTAAGEMGVEGLFKIDEPTLKQLPAPALQELMEAGALAPAYCVLLSLQHMPALLQRKQQRDAATVAAAHAQAGAHAGAPVKGKDLDLSFLEGSGTMKFF